jgi:hypothetical protein
MSDIFWSFILTQNESSYALSRNCERLTYWSIKLPTFCISRMQNIWTIAPLKRKSHLYSEIILVTKHFNYSMKMSNKSLFEVIKIRFLGNYCNPLRLPVMNRRIVDLYSVCCYGSFFLFPHRNNELMNLSVLLTERLTHPWMSLLRGFLSGYHEVFPVFSESVRFYFAKFATITVTSPIFNVGSTV